MINMRKIFLFLTLTGFVWGQTGKINGIVRDGTTQQPLIGANVLVVDTELGDATDEVGRFAIEDIPVGTHHLMVSIIGYEKRMYLNLPVTSARPIDLVVELKVDVLAGEEIEVTGKAFTRSSSSVVSTMHVDNAEIRSDPGGAYDIQRVIQSLPSVTTATDQENEIIARGGMLGENLFLLDDIEIPNPNHFGFEGAGGGPINMINPLFVREIEFTPGAFSACYGDKASSVMDIRLRNGSRIGFEADFDLSMAGAGINLEGPIAGGQGSFMASTSWSYLDMIVESFGMTAVPHYNNHQLKIVYDLTPNNRLIFNGLMGFDNIRIKTESEVVSRGAESVDADGSIYAAGLSLRTLAGKYGYGLTTFSRVNKWTYHWVYHYGNRDDVWFTRDDYITESTLKTNWVLQSSLGHFTIGGSVKRVEVDYNEWARSDTTFLYDTSDSVWTGEEWLVDEPDPIDTIYIRPTFEFITRESEWKLAGYLQWKVKLLHRGQLTVGIRTDYFTATEELVFSPRLNLQFSLGPFTTAHLAYGKHYQYPGYYLVFRDPEGKNKNLKAKYTDQYVAGIEHFFDTDFRGSIEGFYKTYDNIPTHYYWTNPKPQEEYPVLLEHTTHWLNEGQGKSYGLEFFLQKKLTRNWHILFSYAWSHAQAKDVRMLFTGSDSPHDPEQKGDWYDWDYDIRHQLTLVGGWKEKFHKRNWYRDLKQNLWYQIFSMVMGVINPLADEVEANFRFGYNSGRPYTARDYVPKHRDWDIPDDADWNSLRFPEYHRLDFLYLRRYIFKNVNLVTYIDIMNIYDRNNIWDYAYSEEGTKSEVWQFKTMPVGGFTLEF